MSEEKTPKNKPKKPKKPSSDTDIGHDVRGSKEVPKLPPHKENQ